MTKSIFNILKFLINIIKFTIILISIIILLFYFNEKFEKKKSYSIISLERKKNKKMGDSIQYILDTKLISTERDESDIIFLKNLNYIEKKFDLVKIPKKTMWIYGFKGVDSIASKTLLDRYAKKYLDLDSYSKMIPKSFHYSNKDDLQLFQQMFDEKKVYVMKKNIQEKKGIKLSNNKADILESHKDGYIIIQEMIRNPLLYNDRKINIRMYICITIKNNIINFNIYKDGLIFYTDDEFKYNTNWTNQITNSNIDPLIYDNNPLLLSDLYSKLDDDIMLNMKRSNIQIFKNLKKMYMTNLKSKNLNLKKNCTYFLLLGCDIIPLDNGETCLLEINKGPKLNFTKKNDKRFKKKLISDMFEMINILESPFIYINNNILNNNLFYRV